MNRDLSFLFLSRATRLHAFGMTSVLLALHLARRGMSTGEVGLLFTLAMLTDAVLTLVLSTRADKWGRRRTLVLSGFLMALAGVLLVVGESWWVVLLGITIGVISPGGNEVGPFLAVEQACLAQCTTAHQRTKLLAWYNVTGFVATAIGALSAGAWLKAAGSQAGSSLVLWAYAMSGGAVMVLAMLLTRKVEVTNGQNTPPSKQHWTGLGESRSKVARLGGLFALDSFAGGFIPQSLLAYWFASRWSLSEWELGQVFFATSLLSGISGLVAVPMSQKNRHGKHDGFHPSTLQRFVDACTGHAFGWTRHQLPVGASLPVANGRAGATVLRHESCEAGRAFRRQWHHRDGPLIKRLAFTNACGWSIEPDGVAVGPPVDSRRIEEFV